MMLAVVLFALASFGFYVFAAWLDLMAFKTGLSDYFDGAEKAEVFALVLLVLSALCALVAFLGELF